MTDLLHISSDFPDPLAPGKTRAISGLIDLVGEVNHHVYSLNRVSPRRGIRALTFDGRHRAVAYGAPPYGLAHRTCLERVARWIGADLAERGVTPKAIHAHKLTMEGIVGLHLARQLGIPLIVTCQGHTDLKILHARPDLRPLFRRIWQRAAWVFALAPWTADALEESLGARTGPTQCLPCPTAEDRLIAPRPTGPVVRSFFGLSARGNKNAGLLIDAAALAADQLPGLTLEIVGGGPPAAFAALAETIAPVDDVVRLAGPAPHDQVQALMNRSALMVLPSRRESYGMVFAEALLAGCPVIHGRANGLSGYFPGSGFAREAEPGGAVALARQIVDMLGNRERIKAELAAAQADGAMTLLRRPAIRTRYMTALGSLSGIIDTLGRPGIRTAPVAEVESV
ncbi:MAG: glycosyltransferase [Pseudomonadota bacterium]